MNLEAIRIALIQKDLRVKNLARSTGIDYDRLIKVLHGYRAARPEEVTAIAAVLGLTEAAITSGEGGQP